MFLLIRLMLPLLLNRILQLLIKGELFLLLKLSRISRLGGWFLIKLLVLIWLRRILFLGKKIIFCTMLLQEEILELLKQSQRNSSMFSKKYKTI